MSQRLLTQTRREEHLAKEQPEDGASSARSTATTGNDDNDPRHAASQGKMSQHCRSLRKPCLMQTNHIKLDMVKTAAARSRARARKQQCDVIACDNRGQKLFCCAKRLCDQCRYRFTCVCTCEDIRFFCSCPFCRRIMPIHADFVMDMLGGCQFKTVRMDNKCLRRDEVINLIGDAMYLGPPLHPRARYRRQVALAANR